ncbi:MAG: methyltransferase domain-containing protein [Chromatocurvus sp.]
MRDCMTQMTSLHEVRLQRAVAVLRDTGARRILDLGCGSGMLLYRLLAETQFTEVLGLEQSGVSLAQARRMLDDHLSVTSPRLSLLQGSYAVRNARLTGFDAAAMVETIEHMPPGELSTVERAVFGHYRPGYVYMTTPNSEYNPLLGLYDGEFREEDHKFEWCRARFRRWATGVAQRNGYRVAFSGIGDYDPDLGCPTQAALFSRLDSGVAAA